MSDVSRVNTHGGALGVRSPTAPARQRSAREVLDGSLLLMAGKPGRDLVHLVPQSASGLVLTSAEQNKTMRTLRAAFPSMVLAAEPATAGKQYATPEAPFVLPQEDGALFATSIVELLDAQIQAGASFAITPTGYVAPGDADPLKAAINEANELDRDDMVLYLPCDPRWVTKDERRQLMAWLKRSRHPVALALGSETNPHKERGVSEGMREVCEQVSGVMPWRADLAAFDGLAHGAHAAAIGLRAGNRHALEPDHRGFAILTDRTPRVLVPSLLRFMMAGHLDNRFASTQPPVCNCHVCHGRPLTRFQNGQDLEADRHNTLTLMSLFDQMTAYPGGPSAWWTQTLRDAAVEHDLVAAQTGQPFELDRVLKAWLELSGE